VPATDARWGDNLPILFQAKLIQSFENAGYSRSVSRTRDNVTGDYQLLIDIRYFRISTASEPQAEIDFVAKLVDKDGKIVGASTFQDTTPVTGTDTKDYVNALDQGFAKLMTDLVKWTVTALNELPPPPPAPPAPPQASDEAPLPDETPLPPVTVAPPEAPDQPMP
jgi:phospholipid/cholesterol/gamma-HCH transport system substrate-binding protein